MLLLAIHQNFEVTHCEPPWTTGYNWGMLHTHTYIYIHTHIYILQRVTRQALVYYQTGLSQQRIAPH
jgi:hypothetical protein